MHITLIGNKVENSIASCLLASQLEEEVDITLINCAQKTHHRTICSEAFGPLIRRFLNAMGISESKFISKTGALPHISSLYVNWTKSKFHPSFAIPFPHQLDELKHTELLSEIDRTKKQGQSLPHPDSFYFNQVLAGQSREPYSQYSFPFDSDYGFYVELNKLSDFLGNYLAANYGKKLNVVEEQDAKTCLENSDLIIDTRTLEQFDSDEFSNTLLSQCKRAIETDIENCEGSYSPMQYHAIEHGWIYQISGQNHSKLGLVFNDDLSVESAKSLLINYADRYFGCNNLGVDSIHSIDYRSLVRKKIWQGKTLYLGPAMGKLEHLGSFNHDIFLSSLINFLALFKQSTDLNQAAQLYNQHMAETINSVIDFQLAMFGFANRIGKPFAFDLSTRKAPTPSLAHLLSQWQKNGCVVASDLVKSTLVSAEQWNALLCGLNVFGGKKESDQSNDEAVKARAKFYETCALNFPQIGECQRDKNEE